VYFGSVSPATVFNESFDLQKEEATHCDLAVSIVPATLRKVCVILGRGLGNRATNLAIKLQPSKEVCPYMLYGTCNIISPVGCIKDTS